MDEPLDSEAAGSAKAPSAPVRDVAHLALRSGFGGSEVSESCGLGLFLSRDKRRRSCIEIARPIRMSKTALTTRTRFSRPLALAVSRRILLLVGGKEKKDEASSVRRTAGDISTHISNGFAPVWSMAVLGTAAAIGAAVAAAAWLVLPSSSSSSSAAAAAARPLLLWAVPGLASLCALVCAAILGLPPGDDFAPGSSSGTAVGRGLLLGKATLAASAAGAIALVVLRFR